MLRVRSTSLFMESRRWLGSSSPCACTALWKATTTLIRRRPVILNENNRLFSIGGIRSTLYISRFRRYVTDSLKIPFCVQMRVSMRKAKYCAVNRAIDEFWRLCPCSGTSIEWIWLFTALGFVNYIKLHQLTRVWFMPKAGDPWKHGCDAVITVFPHVHMKSCFRL